MDNILGIVMEHKACLGIVGLAVTSELIGLSPKLKSNSIVQLILNGLKKALKKTSS